MRLLKSHCLELEISDRTVGSEYGAMRAWLSDRPIEEPMATESPGLLNNLISLLRGKRKE